MTTSLPSRPNLDHLRRQAKALLQQLRDGDGAAAKTFIAHLPAARSLTPAKARAAGFRLADAQSVIARQTGFAAWSALARHVDDLRALEGEWHFVRLEVDGQLIAGEMAAQSRILIDGDRFRTESPEATYDGVFVIDVERTPHTIDIEFVEGPEAGQHAYGIYELNGDRLTICLGLVGSPRPETFTAPRKSGHALEILARTSSARPAEVSGGKKREQPAAAAAPPALATPADTAGFDVTSTPLLDRLQGEWKPIELIQNGIATKPEWLQYGSRTTQGNEMSVVFGGQTMTRAKMRFDESRSPIAVDYLHTAGAATGRVSLGIFAWQDDDAQFSIAGPGQPRPADFSAGAHVTISRWRRG